MNKITTAPAWKSKLLATVLCSCSNHREILSLWHQLPFGELSLRWEVCFHWLVLSLHSFRSFTSTWRTKKWKSSLASISIRSEESLRMMLVMKFTVTNRFFALLWESKDLKRNWNLVIWVFKLMRRPSNLSTTQTLILSTEILSLMPRS